MNQELDLVVSATTNVVFSVDARKELFAGIKIAAEAVGCTLGPAGKTVLIQRLNESPIVTKDGVTVAKSMKLKHSVMRMGAQLVCEAASRTNDVAGDGTTTSTVLTYALVSEGLKLLSAGYDSTSLCKGIQLASDNVISTLKNNAKQVSTSAEIAQVATISANGDVQIGDIIAKAMEKVGRDGIITVEDAKGMTTTLEVTEGMQFDRGYLSPYFVTNTERMNIVYQDAYVLVTDKKLNTLKDLIPILEAVVKSQKPLIIIADEVEGDAMQGLVLNRVKSNLQVVAIKAPGYGLHRSELLKDICILTGAKMISSSTGLSLDKTTLNDLGRVKKLVVDAKATTLVATGQTKDALDTHVADLHSQLQDVTLGVEEITKLKIRIAKLASGVAVIKVGGSTELEMIERKYRIEDALNATRAAAEEGIVAGGGMALYWAMKQIIDKNEFQSKNYDRGVIAGIDTVLNACLAPIQKISENAGTNAGVVIGELQRRNDSSLGYNAATGEYVDMIQLGIVDPVKVTRVALENAASVAITFLSLNAVIYSEE
jgi:chaperonin GroEL